MNELPEVTVPRIMVPRRRFVRAKDSSEIPALLERHPTLDAFPLPRSGDPQHVYLRSLERIVPIDSNLRITDSTPITRLPHLFKKHDLFFVIHEDRIVGLVHLSDLNLPIAKIPYFILFQDLESNLLLRLARNYADATLRAAFSARQIKSITGRAKRLERSDVLPGPLNALYFWEILHLARNVLPITLGDDDAKILSEKRNDLAHPTRLLVRDRADIFDLLRVEELCRTIMRAF